MEAQITVKMTPAEFDLVRAELQTRSTELKYGKQDETGAEKHARRQRQAQIDLLLTKLR